MIVAREWGEKAFIAVAQPMFELLGVDCEFEDADESHDNDQAEDGSNNKRNSGIGSGVGGDKAICDPKDSITCSKNDATSIPPSPNSKLHWDIEPFGAQDEIVNEILEEEEQGDDDSRVKSNIKEEVENKTEGCGANESQRKKEAKKTVAYDRDDQLTAVWEYADREVQEDGTFKFKWTRYPPRLEYLLENYMQMGAACLFYRPNDPDADGM